MMRAITVSTQPRKKPAIMPIVTPIVDRQAGADERHQQRDARAVEHAREDVAPERVDAEEVLAARPGRAARSRQARPCCRTFGSGVPRILRISGAKIATRISRTMKVPRGQRDLVLAEAAPEELQRRTRSDRRLTGDDLVDAAVLGVQQIAGASSRTQIDCSPRVGCSPNSPNR